MERVDIMLEPLRAFLVHMGELLPNALLALAIVIAGWLAAKAVKFAVVKALRTVNFNVLAERAGIDDFLHQGGTDIDTTAILGLLAYWLVILGAFVIAFNGLGLTYVTDLLGRAVVFVPKAMVAIVILALGIYFARFIGVTLTLYCRRTGLADAELLGRLAMYAIMVFVFLIALDQIGLGDIIRQSFLIILAAVAFGLALAFGLGGQKKAADMLERWSRKSDLDGYERRSRDVLRE